MAEKQAAKVKKAMTKAAVIKEIATDTKLTSKQVNDVLDALTGLVKKELSKKGPGVFTIPGLVKLKTVHKKATKERKGPNPFKPGEDMVFKAKPARTLVKPRALKTLNEMLK
jgi:nucleoid DNA-binding protein